MTNNAPRPAPGSFEAEFQARLQSLLRRADAAGLTVSKLCKQAGTARATPDRWRKRAPLSIILVDRLEAEVVAAEKEAARAKKLATAEQ